MAVLINTLVSAASTSQGSFPFRLTELRQATSACGKKQKKRIAYSLASAVGESFSAASAFHHVGACGNDLAH